ncbi:hypothetical protein [Streptomyces sp. NPDC058254]|uniref:hypothetical protein n=1 Tax=Streptomyces sp. NPDC058254 TaxID=3346406 RepID=UPI0036EC7E70
MAGTDDDFELHAVSIHVDTSLSQPDGARFYRTYCSCGLQSRPALSREEALTLTDHTMMEPQPPRQHDPFEDAVRRNVALAWVLSAAAAAGVGAWALRSWLGLDFFALPSACGAAVTTMAVATGQWVVTRVAPAPVERVAVGEYWLARSYRGAPQ